MPLFAAQGIDAIDLVAAGIPESSSEDDFETADTFEENALAKARYFHSVSGLPTVADDSGLVVDALGGRPGVLSKRWSGRTDVSGQALDDANNRLLLETLDACGPRPIARRGMCAPRRTSTASASSCVAVRFSVASWRSRAARTASATIRTFWSRRARRGRLAR